MATPRAARQGDAAEIARLSGELGYPALVEDMTERLAALLACPRFRVLVVDGEQGLLGWIAMERRIALEMPVRFEIVGLVVDRSIRRGGIGEALVAAAEAWAQAQGAGAVMVRSNTARTSSHLFYEKHGYVRHKTQHVYMKALEAPE